MPSEPCRPGRMIDSRQRSTVAAGADVVKAEASNPSRGTNVRRVVVSPASLNRASGGDWLPERLAKSFEGVATVVFHSLVWQYISEPERESIARTIEEAGRRASEDAPVAWLKVEPSNNGLEIRLRIFPGFEEQVLATTGPHAPSVGLFSSG